MYSIITYFLPQVYKGFLNCLEWINNVMDKPKIFIGENGIPENEGVDGSANKIAYHTVNNMLFIFKCVNRKSQIFNNFTFKLIT